MWALGLLCLLLAPARASVVGADSLIISTIAANGSSGVTFSSFVYITPGGSLIMQGSGGYITTASSITASQFFGDGSQLASVAVLSATQTFLGSNLFNSSVTIQSGGRQIILSTSTSVSNISISSGGVISFYPELHNSSYTIIPQASSTNGGTLGPCVVGSTITITTSGGRVEVVFSGVIQTPVDTDIPALNFLQDGALFLNNGSNTATTVDNRTADDAPATFDALVAPSAGQHSYCLTMGNIAASGNTLTLLNDSTQGNIFFVKELK